MCIRDSGGLEKCGEYSGKSGDEDDPCRSPRLISSILCSSDVTGSSAESLCLELADLEYAISSGDAYSSLKVASLSFKDFRAFALTYISRSLCTLGLGSKNSDCPRAEPCGLLIVEVIGIP